MLSRRQFFSITVIMLVLLVMFQLTGVMKDYWNDYDKNEYADIAVNDKWQDAFKVWTDIEDMHGDYVVFIGNNDDSGVKNMAELWCLYTKKHFLNYDSLSSVDKDIIANSNFVMLDSEKLKFDSDTELLLNYANQGISMIFCNLPDVSVIKNNNELQKLLGIYSVYEENLKVNGFDLYDGFLLGGRIFYEAKTEKDEKRQDLDLSIPWYATYAHVKRYMIGLIDEDYFGSNKIKNEDMPSVIWRNNIGKSRIFVVNGNYMESVTALGIYSAMEYEMNDYQIYPVVNAQSVSISDFAGFSGEYDTKLKGEYSRNQQGVFQDLVWPSLNSVFTITEDKPTYFLSPQLNYSDNETPDDSKLIYYMKLFGEGNSETGLSSLQSSLIEVSSKLESDIEFYDKKIPEYEFSSMYFSEKDYKEMETSDYPKSVRTISLETKYDKEPVSYSDEGIVVQRITVDGFNYKYSDDFRLKSLQTALAYSNISVDLGCLLYSDDEKDTWEHSSERLASNVVTYWKPFKAFDKTTITESDSKIRQFLNLDYNSNKDGNVVYLDIEQFDTEAAFIFRTHNESIKSVKGAEFEEIEEHAYLIRATEEQVEIYLESDISFDINQ